MVGSRMFRDTGGCGGGCYPPVPLSGHELMLALPLGLGQHQEVPVPVGAAGMGKNKAATC